MASSSTNQVYNVADSNSETLNYIQELQTIEQGIFTNLEQNGSSMTEAEQNQLLTQMNDISQMRINLYQSLSGMNNIFQNALSNSRETLDEQIVAIQIVENQLNDAKARLKSLEEEKNNNIRNIQINDYYSERFNQHAKLMKIIVIMLIPIIVLAFLYNKGFLPPVIYYSLLVLIVVVGFYFIFITYNSMMRRDNMNYQQYAWPFNPNDAPNSSGNGDNNSPWSVGSTKLCIGPQCCTQFEMFDVSLNKCILLPTSTNQSANSTSGTNLNAGVNSTLSNLGNDITNEYNGLSNSAAKYLENL